MEDKKRILEGYTDLEKGAYLGAIASIATADREAGEEEIAQLSLLSDAAGLSEQQKGFIIRAATGMSEEDLQRCLDVLKNSELRFSLVADLIAFAKSDGSYHGEEEKNIHKMADYLGVGEKQFSLLDQFTENASEATVEADPDSPQPATAQKFSAGAGLKEKMENAGIDSGSLMKGLLGIAAPLIIGSMLSGGMRRRGMGGFGGGMFGMGGYGGGGLGSIIGMLSGGRGLGSTGGLMGRMFGRRGW
jgi:uncharacterized tellurite resistance protein B-like protein